MFLESPFEWLKTLEAVIYDNHFERLKILEAVIYNNHFEGLKKTARRVSKKSASTN